MKQQCFQFIVMSVKVKCALVKVKDVLKRQRQVDYKIGIK